MNYIEEDIAGSENRLFLTREQTVWPNKCFALGMHSYYDREKIGVTVEELREKLQELLNETLYQMVLSNPKEKGQITKLKIRPILCKGQLVFQETAYVGTKVLHKNYEKQEMLEQLIRQMSYSFKQLEAESTKLKLTALVSKKGKVTVKTSKMQPTDCEMQPSLEHNRNKNYVLPEGEPVPFLVDLGIQTVEGKIVQAKYDKFKQINRYLEFVEDILPQLETKEEITILDFGCGKAYLTFALYYFLTVIRKKQVHMIGMDLKEDVISTCTELKNRYGYEGLEFLQGDISAYQGQSKIDMVVTLHACDTATDYALWKAVEWEAEVVFSVPCCQHEINQQIENEAWEPIFKYGIIKERMSALITDAIRANVLEQCGYETQILEFIDMEHTPKNLLIRAVKKTNRNKIGKQENLTQLLKELHLVPTITNLL